MAKASDLMGRSGAGGLGNNNPFKPANAKPAGPAEHKNPNKGHGGKPTTGNQQAGGGKAPVGRRPKV
jgi:hypothetical protein